MRLRHTPIPVTMKVLYIHLFFSMAKKKKPVTKKKSVVKRKTHAAVKKAVKKAKSKRK